MNRSPSAKARPLWVVTFVDVTEKRVPLVALNVGLLAYMRRTDAERAARVCRAEDREEGIDTVVRVTKYIAEQA